MKKAITLLTLLSGLTVSAQTIEVPIYAVTSLQPAQSGTPISNTMDGDNSTIYHSQWGQNGIPDVVQYYFTSQIESIGRIVYTPRQSGTNGVWTTVNVLYSTQSNPTNFILIEGNLVWQSNNQDKEIILPAAIQNPYCVKFEVNQATGNFSSCAEMRFYSDTQFTMGDDGIDCTIPTGTLSVNGANDVMATISASGSVANQYQPGEDIWASFDGDPNTLYHSPWGANTVFPVTLNYRLSGTTPIDYLKYIPRSSGYNGNFGNVTISYNTTGNATYQNLMSYDFEESGTPVIVNFPSQITPLNIMLTVTSGYGNYASCAEMEFYTAGNSSTSTPYLNVFSNNLYSGLLPNITQAHIDTIASPFYQALAQCIFDETYVDQYRVQAYEVYPKLSSINTNLKVGTYDNFENATGIVFENGEKAALFARNIPSSTTIYLTVKDFEAGFGGTVSHYPLHNGLNVFDLTNGGMAYITYFSNNSSLNDAEINIVSGKINGYFDREISSNSEWPDLLTKTTYPYIDIRGKYAHLVYQRESLRGGSPFDALELIGQYDTIIQHERMLMGWYKYNISPKNRQLTYNEHGGGYYAGGLGVHLDLDWGPEALTDPEQLSIWGIAHEYGHINQIRPDLKWIGTTEVTNNIYTAWADYNMNHDDAPYSRLEAEVDQPAPGINSIEGGRINGAIFNTVVNGEALQGNVSSDVFKILVPFWQLQVYYQLAGASRNAPVLSFDYPSTYTGIDYAHWYGIVSEISRNTNSDGLTNGELLLNFVKNTCDAVEEDLTVFFEKTGFLKPIDREIDDYGIGQLTITQQQIDDTKAYIASKGYQQPVSPNIYYASAHSADMFKNQLPLSGVTGVGVTLNGDYLTTVHSEWHNAVAYETYDANYELIYVSISGTGDHSNQTTQIYYPANAHAVYAVGYDGQRILVYPASVLSLENNKLPELKVYPNPVGKGNTIQLELENATGDYAAEIVSLDGRSVFVSNGSIDNIETAINKNMNKIQSGTYILNLGNDSGNYSIKFMKE